MDIIGSFWTADRPDRRVAGRLTFDHRDGRRLELCGAFHDPKEVISNAPAQQEGHASVGISELLGLDSPPIRILGDTAVGPVTLERCLGTLSTYHVPLVFRGAHFRDDESLKFKAAKFSILHIEQWIGKSGLDASVRLRKGSNQVEQLSIICTPVEDIIAKTPSGQIRLSFGYQLRGDDIVESAIKQKCTLELQFSDSSSIEKVFEAHDALQALIAIGVAAPVRVTEARVLTDNGSWIQVQAYNGGIKDNRDDVCSIRPFDMLFTYNRLGGLTGVGDWLAMSNKFWPVIGMLMSRWYTPDMYGDFQFFGTVTAAETFARIKLQKQSFKFNKELERLAINAGAPFRSVVGDIPSWVKLVVRTRNNHVVHRGKHGNPDGESLYWLSCSLYILVVLCLLRECRVPEKNLPNRETSRWIATVARKLCSNRQPSGLN